jgi:hypothetical protein
MNAMRNYNRHQILFAIDNYSKAKKAKRLFSNQKEIDDFVYLINNTIKKSDKYRTLVANYSTYNKEFSINYFEPHQFTIDNYPSELHENFKDEVLGIILMDLSIIKKITNITFPKTGLEGKVLNLILFAIRNGFSKTLFLCDGYKQCKKFCPKIEARCLDNNYPELKNELFKEKLIFLELLFAHKCEHKSKLEILRHAFHNLAYDHALNNGKLNHNEFVI